MTELEKIQNLEYKLMACNSSNKDALFYQMMSMTRKYLGEIDKFTNIIEPIVYKTKEEKINRVIELMNEGLSTKIAIKLIGVSADKFYKSLTKDELKKIQNERLNPTNN